MNLFFYDIYCHILEVAYILAYFKKSTSCSNNVLKRMYLSECIFLRTLYCMLIMKMYQF